MGIYKQNILQMSFTFRSEAYQYLPLPACLRVCVSAYLCVCLSACLLQILCNPIGLDYECFSAIDN